MKTEHTDYWQHLRRRRKSGEIQRRGYNHLQSFEDDLIAEREKKERHGLHVMTKSEFIRKWMSDHA